ncbi:MAG: universal stress protein [Gemmatimonadota bacterium]
MIRRILVPLDGSFQAEAILRHVLVLSKVFEARLDLLHVIPGQRCLAHGSPTDPLGSRMARAERARYLEKAAALLRRAGCEVWTRVEEGGPAAVIVDRLRRGEHDLVALTPHGAGDDQHLRMGCTALAVIMNARVGIFLAPRGMVPTGNGDLVGAKYAHVLAPVDCSPRSDWSLGLAAAIARASGGRLKIVHVLDSPEIVSRLPRSPEAGSLADRLREENRSEAKSYLDQVAWRFGAPDLPVDYEVLDGGHAPAEALLELCEARDVDLVVLSAHGRGASPAWALGGTAAKLVQCAERPVLILQDFPMERPQHERVSRSIRALARDR